MHFLHIPLNSVIIAICFHSTMFHCEPRLCQYLTMFVACVCKSLAYLKAGTVSWADVQVRDELRDTLPSEVVIPLAEAQNNCRWVLAHPDSSREVKSSGMRVSCLLSSGALFWTILFFPLYAAT